MNLLSKFVKKIQQIRRTVNTVKYASNEISGINRTLNSMRARSNKPSASKLEEVKVTGKRVGSDSGGNAPENFFGKF